MILIGVLSEGIAKGASLVASTYFLEPGDATSPITTQPIDTTGANLIVVIAESYIPTTAVITDNKSNIWSQLPLPSGNQLPSIFFSVNPTVGSGHTFTSTQNGSSYGNNMIVAAFKGLNNNPLEPIVRATTSLSSPASQSPGPVPIGASGDLVIYATALNTGGINAMTGSTVDASLTMLYALDNDGNTPSYPGSGSMPSDFEGHLGLAYGFYGLTNIIPAWDATLGYNQREVVSEGGINYISLVNVNLNNDPATSPSDWGTFPNSWSSTTAYNQGDIVSSGGRNYVSLSQLNLDNTPGGTGWWAAAANFIAPRWLMASMWNSGSTYAAGTVVNYLGNLYINNTGSNAGNPVSDTTDWSTTSVNPTSVVAVFSASAETNHQNPLEYSNVGQSVGGTTTVPAIGGGNFSAYGSGDILIQGLGGVSVGGPVSIDSSYNILDNIGASDQSQACMAWKIATGNTQDSPTWTLTSNSDHANTTMASFKAYGSVSVVDHTTMGSSGMTPITTSPINSIGSQLIVLVASIYTSGAVGEVQVSDSESNIWYPVPRGIGLGWPQIWYCYSPTTSTTHTFTATDVGGSGAALAVGAFTGIYA